MKRKFVVVKRYNCAGRISWKKQSREQLRYRANRRRRKHCEDKPSTLEKDSVDELACTPLGVCGKLSSSLPCEFVSFCATEPDISQLAAAATMHILRFAQLYVLAHIQIECATYETRFCVHSKSRLTSFASWYPSASLALDFASLCWARACKSIISRCLAFKSPDLLIISTMSLIWFYTMTVNKGNEPTFALASPMCDLTATDQRHSQIWSACTLACLLRLHYQNSLTSHYHNRQRHYQRMMMLWSQSSRMVPRWLTLVRLVERLSRSIFPVDCMMSSHIGWWSERRRGGCYMSLGRPLWCFVWWCLLKWLFGRMCRDQVQLYLWEWLASRCIVVWKWWSVAMVNLFLQGRQQTVCNSLEDEVK